MQKSTAGGNSFDEPREQGPREIVIGDADNVQKTTYVVGQMDAEHFGHCTLYGECQEACPKEISIDTIARMNRDFVRASATARPESAAAGGG